MTCHATFRKSHSGSLLPSLIVVSTSDDLSSSALACPCPSLSSSEQRALCGVIVELKLDDVRIEKSGCFAKRIQIGKV
jgi:hypothetical protein